MTRADDRARLAVIPGIAALSLLVGCVTPLAPLDAEGEPAPVSALDGLEARELGSFSFGAEGRTQAIEVPPLEALEALEAPGAEALAILTTAAPGACLRLAEVEQGGAILERARFGSARGAALDVLSPELGLDPRAGLALRVQLVRCATNTPLSTADGEQVRVRIAPLPSALGGAPGGERPPPPLRLPLRLVVTERSYLFGRPDRVEALLAALAEELAEAGLLPELIEAVEVEGAPLETRFSDLELEPLDALLGLAPPASLRGIDVVFAGCLRRVAPTGVSESLLGFTPRVGGGGGGGADAVFLPGVRCDAFRDAPEVPQTEGYAHLLAHELGHYLGLPHTVERDGAEDPFEDSGEDNLMSPNPQRAAARGLSATQVRHLRRHPLLLASD